jgi:hypothetical protein
MSYYQNPSYDVYAYEYGNNGNHGDIYDGYESFSDHAEPDHCEYEDQYHNDADHEYAPQEPVHGHGEPEYGIQGLEELEPHYDGTGEDWETRDEREIEGDEEIAHELGKLEREYEGGIYEPSGLEYEGHEHGELMHEPKRDAEANYTERNAETGYAEREPTGFDCNVEQTGEYTPHPFPPFPNPPPTPRTCDAPRSNQ